MVEEEREPSGVSFARTLISFIRASPSPPDHLPKAPPPDTITSDFGGTHIQSTADCWCVQLHWTVLHLTVTPHFPEVLPSCLNVAGLFKNKIHATLPCGIFSQASYRAQITTVAAASLCPWGGRLSLFSRYRWTAPLST